MIEFIDVAYETGFVADKMSRADYYALTGIVAIEQSIAKNNREESCTIEGDCMPMVYIIHIDI